jgi:hypothetical protein
MPKPELKLKKNGAEPREKAVYAFELGKVWRVLGSFTTSVRPQMALPPGQKVPEPPPARVQYRLLAKEQTKPDVTAFALSGEKFTSSMMGEPGANPQAEAQLNSMNALFAALRGRVSFSTQGTLEDVDFGAIDPNAQQAAGAVFGMVQQGLELLLAILPSEPIGVGAEWEAVTKAPPPMQGSMVSTFVLKERTPTGATIAVTTRRDMGPQPINHPSAPQGATMEMHAKGSYTLAIRFNGPAAKAQGYVDISQKMSTPGAKAPPGGDMSLRITQALESTPVEVTAASGDGPSAQ